MCKLIKVRQKFNDDKLYDVKSSLIDELNKSGVQISKGQRIAIATGSRGIANIFEIIKSIVEFVKAKGGVPFIIPAMGSHGGANAQGQLEVLESFNITEKSLGVPILSSMAVIELPQGESRAKVFMDEHAYKSDGVILVNRIKPHTDYHGAFESGLVKMSVIGLGKHQGALEIHKYGLKGMLEYIPEVAREILKSNKILLGVGIVENSKDETSHIKAIKPENLFDEEPKLLKIAVQSMPWLPVNTIDILMVDELGKDMSGTGLDPNITGRMKIRDFPEPKIPDVKYIMITDLTKASHGNAVGVGFADVITKGLYEKINFAAMYENVITSTFLERAKIPLIADTPKRAFEILKRVSLSLKSQGRRIIRIKNTLHIDELWVSDEIYTEIRDRVVPVSDFINQFEANGSLITF